MKRSADESTPLSYIVVVDEKGERTQVIELPTGVKTSEIEALVAGDKTSWSYVPAEIALSSVARLGPEKLFIPKGKTEKELFLGKVALPGDLHDPQTWGGSGDSKQLGRSPGLTRVDADELYRS
jgi:hypothetical protein